MRELSFRNVDVSDKAQAELKNARKRIDELNAEMNRLISQVIHIYCWCKSVSDSIANSSCALENFHLFVEFEIS